MALLNEIIARNLKRFGIRVERIETRFGDLMVNRGASGETFLSEMKEMREITRSGMQSRRVASRGLRGPFVF